MKKITLILTVIGLIIIGCENQEDSHADRESELLSLLDDDEALGIEGLDDGDAVNDEYTADSLESAGKINLGKVMEVFHPDSGYIYKFGRKITSKTKTITYTHGDDFSIANITWTISGDFICGVIDTATADTNKTEKPFTSEFHRMVRFVEGNVTDWRGRRWRVDAFTMGTGSTDDIVAVTKLEYFTMNSENTWEPGFVITSDEAETRWIQRDSIPTFYKGDSVKIEVSVTNNSDPVFDYKSGEGVVVHYGRHRYYKARRKMHDDGVEPDAGENDNTFTKIWRIHGPGYYVFQPRPYRVFRAFFDVMDFGTLFDTEEDVHTAFWGLPYKVIRE
jgi:hypothetical protein